MLLCLSLLDEPHSHMSWFLPLLVCPEFLWRGVAIYIYTFGGNLQQLPSNMMEKNPKLENVTNLCTLRPTLAIILVYFKTAWHTLVLEQESGIWGCRLRNKWLLCSQFLTVWPTAAEKARVPNLKMDLFTDVNPLTIYVYHSFCILWCELCLLGWTGTQVHTFPQIAKSRIIA